MPATERLRRAGRRAPLAVGCAIALGPSPGWCNDAVAPSVLVVSADGHEVVNTQGSIAWARCVEGMRWSGKTCVGAPRLLDHAQALAVAAARRQADGKPWRLPRVPELKRLFSQQAQAPAPSSLPFPAAPRDWLWTASTSVDTSRVNPYDYNNIRRGVTNENVTRISFLHGWAVHMGTGDTSGGVAKRTPLAVRLVRSLDP